jgi:hypothetical protein
VAVDQAAAIWDQVEVPVDFITTEHIQLVLAPELESL